jgi:uncharacterized membrane protein
MALRSARDRAVQTLLYELGGLALVTPAYALISGSGAGESLTLMVALSVAVMVWSPLHNTVFDLIEWRRCRRVASDRPLGWRLVHAFSHEVTTLIVTLPLILWLTDLGVVQALLLDLGLSAFYALWALVFHAAYDRINPILRKVTP